MSKDNYVNKMLANMFRRSVLYFIGGLVVSDYWSKHELNRDEFTAICTVIIDVVEDEIKKFEGDNG